MVARPFRALLIDLDGVLRDWPGSDAALERSFDLPEGALRRTAFARPLLDDVITGRVSDDAWRNLVTSTLSRLFPGARVAEAVAAWSAPVGVVNEKVRDLVRRARAHVRVVLVTNAISRLPRDLTRLGLDSCLDAVVNSSVVGAAKPDEAIYVAALRAAGVTAAEALFVDDSRAHVDAARRLGLSALHFRDASGLAAFLQEHGVLGRAGSSARDQRPRCPRRRTNS